MMESLISNSTYNAELYKVDKLITYHIKHDTNSGKHIPA